MIRALVEVEKSIKSAVGDKPKPTPRKIRLREFLLCVCSAVLLTLAFPKTNYSILAWLGFLPLFIALEKVRPAKAFRIAYFCGLIFFWAVFYWLTNVTFLGTALLCAYFALYFGIFGWVYSLTEKFSHLLRCLILACLWVSMEFAKAYLFSGLDWAGLGHSQFQHLETIQIADITGMYGVSFLIIVGNYIVRTFFIDYGFAQLFPFLRKEKVLWILGIALIGSNYIYGMQRLNQFNYQNLPTMRVAVVQGNIPQEMKWDPTFWPHIMDEYLQLTQQAATAKPDLIIWPETAFPGYLWDDKDSFTQVVDAITMLRIPLLFGSVSKYGENFYYNSAILLGPDGNYQKKYDKIHLVPFGEYIPLRKQLPFLEAIVPIDDFTAGERYTLFEHASTNGLFTNKYAALICFEDTVAYLSRNFAKEGAELFINMTNDAWFKDTKEPYMHLQAAVFRSIENRRAMIRAANTGVSAIISPVGEVVGTVQDDSGKETYISGFTYSQVPFLSEQTIYTKFGDIFAYLCFGGILGGLLLGSRAWLKQRKSK